MFIFVPVYILACTYLKWQLIWWLKKTRFGKRHNFKWLAVFLYVLDAIPIAGAFLPESRFQSTLQMIGNVWVGFVLAGAMTLVFAHIFKLVFRKRITEKFARIVVIIVVLFTSIYNIYGFMNAQNIYSRYYSIELGNSGAELISESASKDDEIPKKQPGNTRIAFIADMHMGVNSDASTIKEMVDMVKSSGAEYVLGGGDYFTSSYQGLFEPDAYSKLLASMTDSVGGKVYCAYGNHDVGEPLFCGFAIEDSSEAIREKEMDDFFKRCKWNMLADQSINIGDVQVFFRKDQDKTGDGINNRADIKDLLKNADQTKPIVVVQHEPEKLEELDQNGVDLELSGHTHDGQIWPGNWFSRIKSENSCGYKKIGKLSSIVSAGVGYFGPPLRVGTHGELVIIDIKRVR